MTPRERVVAALNREKPDRIPKALGFFPQSLPAIGNTAPEDHFQLDVGFVEFNPPTDQDRFLEYLDRLPADIHVGNYTQLQTYHEWDYHPEHRGLGPLESIQSIEELADHVFPDLTHPSRYRGLTAEVARWHHKGLAVAGAPRTWGANYSKRPAGCAGSTTSCATCWSTRNSRTIF